MGIKYPLIGRNSCTKEEAKYFEHLLAEKCKEIKEQDENCVKNPEFCILKTKNDKSFGVILSNEVRYVVKQSLLAKLFGLKPSKISYNPNNFKDQSDYESFLKRSVHVNPKKMQPKNFLNLSAYTLSENNQLEQIASMSYIVEKEKNFQTKEEQQSAYVDGVVVKNAFKRQGVATSMQELLHILLMSTGVEEITMDVVKDAKWNLEKADYDIDPISNYFKLLKNMGYDVASYAKMNDPLYWTTPLKKELNNDVVLKRVIVSYNEFYVLEDNFKENQKNSENIQEDNLEFGNE